MTSSHFLVSGKRSLIVPKSKPPSLASLPFPGDQLSTAVMVCHRKTSLCAIVSGSLILARPLTSSIVTEWYPNAFKRTSEKWFVQYLTSARDSNRSIGGPLGPSGLL